MIVLGPHALTRYLLARDYGHDHRFYYSKPINTILSELRSPTSIAFKDILIYDFEKNTLRRYYTIVETIIRLMNYAKHYSQYSNSMKPVFHRHSQRKFLFHVARKKEKLKTRLLEEKQKTQKSIIKIRVLKKLEENTRYLNSVNETPNSFTSIRSEEPISPGFKQTRRIPEVKDGSVHDIYDSPRAPSDLGDHKFGLGSKHRNRGSINLSPEIKIQTDRSILTVISAFERAPPSEINREKRDSCEISREEIGHLREALFKTKKKFVIPPQLNFLRKRDADAVYGSQGRGVKRSNSRTDESASIPLDTTKIRIASLKEPREKILIPLAIRKLLPIPVEKPATSSSNIGSSKCPSRSKAKLNLKLTLESTSPLAVQSSQVLSKITPQSNQSVSKKKPALRSLATSSSIDRFKPKDNRVSSAVRIPERVTPFEEYNDVPSKSALDKVKNSVQEIKRLLALGVSKSRNKKPNAKSLAKK